MIRNLPIAVCFGVLLIASGVAAVAATQSRGSTLPALKVGAIYPLAGGGPPAMQEFHGLVTAVRMVNGRGGIKGRQVDLRLENIAGGDQAPQAVSRLVRQHVAVIVGSESSLVGIPASEAAQASHTVYLEAGAVATMLTVKGQSDVFRTVTTGQTLGRSAADFAARTIAPRLHVNRHNLRVAVVYIRDAYGSSVAAAQTAETRRLGMDLVHVFAYQEPEVNFHTLVAALKRSRPDVVLVAAYIPDAFAFRRETLQQHLHVGAMIGTSSSFCMPAFGDTLGWKAVGLFASDKPDVGINPKALDPAARALSRRANSLYRRLYGNSMTGPAVAGFVAGWVLLHDALPHARSFGTASIRRALIAVNLPSGSQINGAGVRFARPSAGDAGQNLRATSVIWQWQKPGKAVIVAPPVFALGRPRFIPLPEHP